MKILVINAGSSSLKYQLIDMETTTALAKGNCDRIGLDGVFKHKTDRADIKKEVPMKTHADAIKTVIGALTDPETFSYTHLDVYKRQTSVWCRMSSVFCSISRWRRRPETEGSAQRF